MYKFSAFHENSRESYVGGIVLICKHSRERLYFIQLLIRKNVQVVAVWKKCTFWHPKKIMFSTFKVHQPTKTEPIVLKFKVMNTMFNYEQYDISHIILCLKQKKLLDF